MRCRAILAALCICLPAGLVWAQGTRVAIRSQTVRAEITGRLSTTTVEQVWVNYTDRPAEAVFTFRLPPDAAVHELAMWVDGKRSPGEIHPRVAAERIYREIVQGKRDPALLTSLGGGVWQLQLFPIPVRGTQKVEFAFTQLLPVREGQIVYEGPQALDSSTTTRAQDHDFSAVIRLPGGLKDLQSPTHSLGIQQRAAGEVLAGMRCENDDLTKPLRLKLQAGQAPPETVTWVESGASYFAAVAVAPESFAADKPRKRTMVFVVDASASMAANKWDLAREGIYAAIKSLTAEESFGLVVMGSDAAMWKDAVVPATPGNQAAAAEFLRKYKPAGGADLTAGIKAALSFQRDANQFVDVLMISDFQDRVGTEEAKPVAKAPAQRGEDTSPLRPEGISPSAASSSVSPPSSSNGGKAEEGGEARGRDALATRRWPAEPPLNCRFFALQAGDYADDVPGLPGSLQETLPRWAAATGGAFIVDDFKSALERALRATLYPVITDVKCCFAAEGGLKLEDVSASEYAGGRSFTIAGRYQGQGPVTVTISANSEGRPVQGEVKLELPKPADTAGWAAAGLTRVWAHLRGGQMWHDMKAGSAHAKDLKDLLSLSRKFRTLSPATAFIVLETDADYIRRGIEHQASSLSIDESLAAQEAALAASMKQLPSSKDEEDRLGKLWAQARELQRLGEDEEAADVLETIGANFAGQFQAAHDAATWREWLALKQSIDEDRSRKEELKDSWATAPWYQMLSDTGATDHVPLPTGARGEGRMLAESAPPPNLINPAVQKKLQARLKDASFDNTEVKNVLEWVDAVSGLKIHVKWTVLETAGITPATAVKSVHLKDVPVEQALRTILEDVGGTTPLSFIVEDNVLTVSTKDDLSAPRYRKTIVYDVRDLAPAWPKHRPLPPSSGGVFGGSGQSAGIFGGTADAGGDTYGGRDAPAKGGQTSTITVPGTPAAGGLQGTGVYDISDLVVTVPDFAGPRPAIPQRGGPYLGENLASPYELGLSDENPRLALMRLIARTIDKDSWMDPWGTGTVGGMSELGGVLVITQTLDNHLAIADLLEKIRKARPSFPNPASEDPRPPDAIFAADGHVSAWVLELLKKAKEGRLSEFSSAVKRDLGGRSFARVGGFWLDLELTDKTLVHPVAAESPAEEKLRNAWPSWKDFFAARLFVVVCLSPTMAVCVEEAGIEKAGDAKLLAILEEIGKGKG